MAKKTRESAPQPSSRLPLNRDRILTAAVEIADERGVGAVTMREVASRLGVEAMSLYNHVANKDDILDGMVDLVVRQVDLPEDVDDWREAMRRRTRPCALSCWKCVRSHRTLSTKCAVSLRRCIPSCSRKPAWSRRSSGTCQWWKGRQGLAYPTRKAERRFR